MRRVLVALVAVAVGGASAAAANAPLRHHPGWDDYAPAWSPGGSRILYGSAWEAPKSGADYRLTVLASNGASADEVPRPTSDYEEWDFPGRWSPAGERFAFVREEGLTTTSVVVADADGRHQHVLLSDARSPDWSPDGTLLAFTQELPNTFDSEIWTMRPDGSDRRRLATGGWADGALWSPDGRRIAFERGGPEERRDLLGVWVMDADGSHQRRLLPRRDDVALDWASDSSALLVERGSDNGQPSLWLVPLAGAPRRLGDGSDGSFSPDGKLIAFDHGGVPGDDAPEAVYVMRADGTGRRRLARHLLGPSWSPDGRTLAASGRGPCVGSGIYVVALASRRAHRLTNDCRITGTPGRDVLRGTSEADVVRGLGGNDLILANPGDQPPVYYGRVDADWVDAGPGNDVVFAGRGQDVVRGGPGDDRLYGGRGPDRLFGGAGDDVLDGGPYYDRLSGGAGDDLILARDGLRDRISCGPGFDTVRADRSDLVAADCERVTRR